MRCEETPQRLARARTGSAQDAELRAHLKGCADCRAQAALDRVLALDVPHAPGPGFDTRMFARLAEERAAHARKRPLLGRLRWTLALVPAIAALVFVLMRREPAPPQLPAELATAMDPEELQLAMDLELAMELEVVEQLDALEDFELLADVDESELAAIASEVEP